MKALGANDFQVCSIFLLHGAVVGVVGAIGRRHRLSACSMLHNLNAVRDFILHVFHIQVFAGSVYGLPDHSRHHQSRCKSW